MASHMGQESLISVSSELISEDIFGYYLKQVLDLMVQIYDNRAF